LATVEAELRDEYFHSLRRRRLIVLVESKVDTLAGDRWLGTSCRYAPVELGATSADVGCLVDCIADQVADGRILAQVPRETAFLRAAASIC
jgi:threonylcarbamoyladenosine tRNA methylthiotransferase MtaB